MNLAWNHAAFRSSACEPGWRDLEGVEMKPYSIKLKGPHGGAFEGHTARMTTVGRLLDTSRCPLPSYSDRQGKNQSTRGASVKSRQTMGRPMFTLHKITRLASVAFSVPRCDQSDRATL